MKNAIVCLIFTVFVAMSCTSDNSATLTEPANTVELTTYNNNVKAIIDNNCITCHANIPTNNAPYSLTTYADVKLHISDIINRISRANGAVGLMPQGGPRLPQTSINVVNKWQTDGLIEKN